jgi:undecaprenyl-diphosphatase
MSYLHAIIIAIVQGITEFLPISSTGHMIITQSLLGIPSDEFTKAFIVNIQFGSILSVIVLYWKRFFQTFNFYYKLFIAFIPAVIMGLLLNDFIDSLMSNVMVVAVSLLLGGIILIFIDKWFNNTEDKPQEITYKSAFYIGMFQCIAMIPGVSRSAATIIGGMTQKLNRKNAAEFSFFLAVPTLLGASALKVYKTYELINVENVKVLAVGNVVAFLVAMIAIKTFITFLTKYGFKVFGYYRIILGLALIILLLAGFNLSII